jgi:hypothetical protein
MLSKRRYSGIVIYGVRYRRFADVQENIYRPYTF